MRSFRYFTLFFSCDVRKEHHSKARSIESIVRFRRLFVKLTIGIKTCPLPESFPTQVAKSIFHTIQNALTFSPRIAIRRNLMHADSFLFISRVAASINHAFFNHFLCLAKSIAANLRIFQQLKLAQCPFLTSRSIYGHIWPSGELLQTIGENIVKTAFTFSAREKAGFNTFEFFSKMSS